MTILGKMLVVFNLIFTLIVGTFLVLVYSARTNWEAAYKKMEQNYNAARAAADVNAEEAKKAQADAKTFEANQNERLKKEKAEYDDLAKRYNDLAVLNRNTKESLANKDRELDVMQNDVKRMQQEKQAMEVALVKRDDDNKNLQRDYNRANQESIGYKLQADSFKLRNRDLVNQLRESEKVAASGGGNRYSPNGNALISPPPTNVEGLITKVDEQSQLLSISIGSDSGLQKGNTLDAYRFLGDKGQYLGTIRVVEVRAKEAVARPENVRGQQLRAGDRVGVVDNR